MKKIGIVDVTLREGMLRRDTSLSFREKIEIAKLSDRLSVDVIETAPITDEKTDSLVLRTLASVLGYSALAVDAGKTVQEIDRAWAAVKNAKKPRLSVRIPVSPVQMEYIYHKKPAAVLDSVKALVAHAASLCRDVEFAALDATRAEADFLAGAVTAAIEAGASVITLCDTAATALPGETAEQIAGLYALVPSLKGVTLGFEGSDALGMANANIFAAVNAGVGTVKLSVTEGAAPSLASFAAAVKARGESQGFGCCVAMTKLNNTVKQIAKLINETKNDTEPFDTESGTAQSAKVLLDGTADIKTVGEAVKSLGYELSEDDAVKVYEAFCLVAEKKQVGTKELDAIVASTALQVPPTYKLESYVINSGNNMSATAHIVLDKNGRDIEGVSLGDGPIDASFLTIEQIIGHRYELDDFQIQAVTESSEAMGEAIVKLRSSGKLFSGRGISTDIIGASIRAYINALNKIVFEESAE